MKRCLALLIMGLTVVGCQSLDDRSALRPLPENAPPSTYAELLTRARAQASIATEAYYKDNWLELEDAAKALEQTAKRFPKSTDVPAKQQDTLVVLSGQIEEQAVKLAKAARDKKEEDVRQVLTQLHQRVRQLRLSP